MTTGRLPAESAPGPAPVVLLEGVSKSYRMYRSPKDRVIEALHPGRKRLHEDFWAVRDVSLRIERGQSVGLLGRNGAGKSTLLQLIAGVITPTAGRVNVSGRIAALLELGAGFNPDLTGRENVALFSVIVGIAKPDIAARVAAVEEFADIGEFFDQPMRIYSSGMYARVAFANAIHVDPDLLIVDEILGVGDAKFQEKCYAKIEDLRNRGVSILFVSHSTEVVQRNCDHAALLDKGRVVTFGPADVAIAAYHDLLYGRREETPSAPVAPGESAPAPESHADVRAMPIPPEILAALSRPEPAHVASGFYNAYERRFGSRDAEIEDFCVTVDGSTRFETLSGTETVSVFIKVRFHRAVEAPQIGWALVSPQGLVISGSNTMMRRMSLPRAKAGSVHYYGIELAPALCRGEYFMNIGVGELVDNAWSFLDNRRSAIHLTVGATPQASGFFDVPSRCFPLTADGTA